MSGRIRNIAITVVSATIIFYFVNSVLLIKRTDGITPMQNFYLQEKNTVDVLFLGSSHAGMNLDSTELWNDYGISSYALWGSVQPFWNSYYFLNEALKVQTPKVVVLDVYASTFDFEYSDDARQVTNLEGMRFSIDKIRAICDSAPEDRRMDLILGYPLYHSRYSELTKNDFEHFPWSDGLVNDKGTGVRYGAGNYEMQNASEVTDKQPIHEKEECFLRKIIELCAEKDIPLVLIKTPTTSRIGEQPFYNSVKEIADEYSVPFLNFNLMDEDTGLNAADYWTDNGHLNTNGARKISAWLGTYLVENYSIANHRGDPDYESWEISSRSLQNEYLKMITDSADYFDELTRRDMAIFVVKNSGWETSEAYENLIAQISKVCSSSDEILLSSGGDWLLTSTQNGELINQYSGNMYSEFVFDQTSFSADFATGTGIRIGGETLYQLNGPGVICLVYDKSLHRWIDTVTFLQYNNFQLVHE